MLFATTYISPGAVSGVWRSTGNPYIVQGDIWVRSGYTLTIESGTIVEFYGNFSVPYSSHLIIEDACHLKFGGAWFLANNIWYYDAYRLFVVGELDAGDLNAAQTVFTKLNGYDGWGGIIFLNSNPNNYSSLKNCRIEYAYKTNTYNNNLYESAGALYVQDYDNLEVENCIFEYNLAYKGGAIYCENSSVPFINSTFSYNEAVYNGGAVCGITGNPDFNICSFTNNQAEYGGAVFEDGDEINFNHCNFEFNTAFQDGGAIYFTQAVGDFSDHSYINNNIALNGSGGGIYMENQCNVTLTLSKIMRNSCNLDGGGICSENSKFNLINCLIVENEAARYGGGYYTFDNINPSKEVNLNNNTIAFNEAAQGGMQMYSPGFGANFNAVNNIIWGLQGSDLGGDFATNVNTSIFSHCDISDPNLSPSPNAYGTFNADPMFVAGYLDGYHVHGTNNIPQWHKSPCIDAGDNNVSPIGAKDLNDEDRVWDNIDIGAYENPGYKPNIMPNVIKEESSDGLKIFCTKNNIWFESVHHPVGKYSLRIIDVNGKIVIFNDNIKDGQKTDVSGLNSGIYLIELQHNASKLFYDKFIKY